MHQSDGTVKKSQASFIMFQSEENIEAVKGSLFQPKDDDDGSDDGADRCCS